MKRTYGTRFHLLWGRLERTEEAADAPATPVASRRRGRTTLLIAGAAVLGLVAGTCAGYLVQADREPTKLPSLSQPTLAQARGEGLREPLSAAQDRRLKTGGDLRKQLSGLRHAARGWTTQDGTRTRVCLLQFDTAAVVDKLLAGEAVAYSSPTRRVRGTEDSAYDEGFPEQAGVSGIKRSVYFEAKPYGAEQVRHAYLAAGDVYAVILQSRKGTAPPSPG